MKTAEEMKVYLEQELENMEKHRCEANKGYIAYHDSDPKAAAPYNIRAKMYYDKMCALQRTLDYLEGA